MILECIHNYYRGRFQAMGSPCELLIDTTERNAADKLLTRVMQEAQRIEHKFSRYRDDNIVYAINHHSFTRAVPVDEETARLVNYAQQCYELSEGLFDISAGVLNRVWRFDGSDRVPSQMQIRRCLALVGWEQVRWEPPYIELREGMQLDFGGIGKEYAVDRCAQLLRDSTNIGCLVNFGGDIAVAGQRANGKGWHVGLEPPDNQPRPVEHSFELRQGAVATSGDAKRFVMKDGIRYGHILNPKTGHPPEDAPRSITVVAPTCSQAGTLSTLAILQGANAEKFLQQQDVLYWCRR